MNPSPQEKPRPKYLGTAETASIDHAGDAMGTERGEDLVGTVAHGETEDLQAEEPSFETEGSTETA